MRISKQFCMAGFKTKQSRSFPKRGILCLTLATCFVASASADLYQITVTNNTTVFVDDVHFLISGTGGSIKNRMVLSPTGGVILPSAGNEFNASFDPLAPGGLFVGQFECNPGTLKIEEAWWTIGGVKYADIPLTSIDLDKIGGGGAPGPAAVAPFAVGLIGAFRKRRKRTASSC